MDPSKDQLMKHFGQIGQILDGLWFLEVEKKFGFEVAYEIDEIVWKVFARKEAKKIQNLLGFSQVGFEELQMILRYLIFNQSLDFELKDTSNPSNHQKILQFDVNKCKTYEGMRKVGRSDEQIAKICYGIEIALLEGVVKEFFPNAQIRCRGCPKDKNCVSIPVCSWEIFL